MEVNEPAAHAYGKKHYTVEEYLEVENAATEKHEYYQGEMSEMLQSTIPHDLIAGSVYAKLVQKLEGSTYNPLTSAVRVHAQKNSFFSYPDVTIVCNPIETLNDDEQNVLNPVVIFEVSSSSTEGYEHSTKFMLYRQIPALKQYVIIHSEFVLVEAYHINADGNWVLREYKDISDVLQLSPIKIQLPLSEIYFIIKFKERVQL